MNIGIYFLAALIPLIVGMIYYNRKVLGNAWMRASGLTEEQLKGANMAKVFILTYVMSLLISFTMTPVVVHQIHLNSIIMNQKDHDNPESEAGAMVKGMMDKYGTEFRTFKHGLFHGVLTALLLIMPILAINALFERKGVKYIFIHTGFWAISLGLIGGLVCAYGVK